MTERQGFSGGHLVLAVAGGALVGAVVALLLTPKSGRELRSRMRELSSQAREKAARVPPAFGEATDVAREAFASALERG
jgi:gas vesicle protein